MLKLFNQTTQECSKIITQNYSTSFASAINLLKKNIRQPIYNIYGFVRFADEIVDTFHGQNKELLLLKFKEETFFAIENKISLNPVLNSFQLTVNEFNIELHLINAFFKSMEMDLCKKNYSETEYKNYIYGSAEVVGLMCLTVFCNRNKKLFDELIPYAKSLGSAFQKVNFLRDVNADFEELNRLYFPNTNSNKFTQIEKNEIESDIENDFKKAFIGIKQLPINCRFGVYVAYKYYYSLFYKIKKLTATNLVTKRIRIPNYKKFLILTKAQLRYSFNLL